MVDNTDTLINQNIKNIDIEDEMKKSYLDYAMSVIVSRALPDVRDGLKPVHRRIVYSMNENSFSYNKPYKKSARIVGDVIGKYHPHGDSAIYEAMVRMAQPFSMRLPLVDGQGNFGSMDGDGAAAMRYTEARMALSSHYLIEDIDKDTVDFRPNYDDSLLEPEVLPSRYPNILVNGGSGIAVGMATNIPTHNLAELCEAVIHLIDSPEASIDDLMQIVKGPDFPTGCKVIGKNGISNYLHTGRGSVVISSLYDIEEASKGKYNIIIKEIPWQVNKSKLVEEISRLHEKKDDKSLDVISSIRDESDRHGVRIIVELKRDINPEIIVNYLQKYTSFQVTFSANVLAIHKGIPKLMNLKDILEAFIDFRQEVIKRRTLFLLEKARDKAHIYSGLAVAVENIDEIIETIRNAPNPAVAKEELMAKNYRAGIVEQYIKLLAEDDRVVIDGNYKLSEKQAKAILDLRLHRLTGLERDKILAELDELGKEITEYLDILNSKERILNIVKDETNEAKEKFGSPRRTSIEENYEELDEEDFINEEPMVVTISNKGYLKRVSITNYKSQRRGGKGKTGVVTREEDFVTNLFVMSTHDDVLFFTNKGMVYKLKCYKIPEGSPTSTGRAIVNILPVDKDESITTILPVPTSTNLETNLVFSTSSGEIRKNSIKDFINTNSKGKIAIKLEGEDLLIGVHVLDDENKDVLISSINGKSIRFGAKDLRVFKNRSSYGVRAIKLQDKDSVINMSILEHEKIEEIEKRDEYLKFSSAKRRGEEIETTLSKEEIDDLAKREELILTVTSNGFGKLCSAYEYRITGRGGSGFLNAKLSDKNGVIVAIFTVILDDELMLVSSKGKIIRISVKDIRITGRVSVGVTLFKTEDGESVVSVSKIAKDISGDAEDEKDETFNEDLFNADN